MLRFLYKKRCIVNCCTERNYFLNLARFGNLDCNYTFVMDFPAKIIPHRPCCLESDMHVKIFYILMSKLFLNVKIFYRWFLYFISIICIGYLGHFFNNWPRAVNIFMYHDFHLISRPYVIKKILLIWEGASILPPPYRHSFTIFIISHPPPT